MKTSTKTVAVKAYIVALVLVCVTGWLTFDFISYPTENQPNHEAAMKAGYDPVRCSDEIVDEKLMKHLDLEEGDYKVFDDDNNMECEVWLKENYGDALRVKFYWTDWNHTKAHMSYTTTANFDYVTERFEKVEEQLDKMQKMRGLMNMAPFM